MKKLQNDWVQTIASIIRLSLGDLGKGWYDMNEGNYETYDISKLSRMNEVIKHRMQVIL